MLAAALTLSAAAGPARALPASKGALPEAGSYLPAAGVEDFVEFVPAKGKTPVRAPRPRAHRPCAAGALAHPQLTLCPAAQAIRAGNIDMSEPYRFAVPPTWQVRARRRASRAAPVCCSRLSRVDIVAELLQPAGPWHSAEAAARADRTLAAWPRRARLPTYRAATSAWCGPAGWVLAERRRAQPGRAALTRRLCAHGAAALRRAVDGVAVGVAVGGQADGAAAGATSCTTTKARINPIYNGVYLLCIFTTTECRLGSMSGGTAVLPDRGYAVQYGRACACGRRLRRAARRS